ncbi:MAG: PhoH family protein [Ignavibacteria bacterium]|nr:PhoH family protein [Ignavibacteria bacterium]
MDIPLVSMTGKAGTGKTLLAIASAIADEKLQTDLYFTEGGCLARQ